MPLASVEVGRGILQRVLRPFEWLSEVDGIALQ
jgi:hypothetical protein